LQTWEPEVTGNKAGGQILVGAAPSLIFSAPLSPTNPHRPPSQGRSVTARLELTEPRFLFADMALPLHVLWLQWLLGN
jgi:hypothetical protein